VKQLKKTCWLREQVLHSTDEENICDKEENIKDISAD